MTAPYNTRQPRQRILAQYVNDIQDALAQLAYNIRARNYNADNAGVTDIATALQAAIDGSSVGDTVYIPRGSYNLATQVTINKALTLKLAAGVTLTYNSSDPGTTSSPILIAAHNVTVEGSGISSVITQGAGKNIQCLLYSGTYQKIAFRNLKLDGNEAAHTGAVTGRYFTGIRTDPGSEDVTIEKVWFAGCGNRATDLRGTVRSWHRDCWFINTGLYCIAGAKAILSISRSGSTVTVETTAAHGFNSNDGVAIWGVTDSANFPNAIFNITVTDATHFTYTHAGNAVSSSGGFCNNQGGNAISVDVSGTSYSSDAYVIGNYFDGFGDTAIGLPHTKRPIVMGNIIRGRSDRGAVPLTTESGISLAGCEDAIDIGNVIRKVYAVGIYNDDRVTAGVNYPIQNHVNVGNVLVNALGLGTRISVRADADIGSRGVVNVGNIVDETTCVSTGGVGITIGQWVKEVLAAGNLIRADAQTAGQVGIQISNAGGTTVDEYLLNSNLFHNLARAVEVQANAGGNGVIQGNNAQNPTSAALAYNLSNSPIPQTRNNVGQVRRNAGAAASVADGGTISHGLFTTPTWVIAVGTVAGEFISVTAKGSSTFTVAIKTHAGAAGTTQTIYWWAGYD